MKWNEMSEINVKRFNYGTALFKDILVVCGGYDGKNYLSSSEAYNGDLKKWNSISSLKKSRAGNQSTTSGGCLYTMGGYDGINCLSSVERLDGLDQSWKLVSSMQTRRSSFAAVSCNDVIYAIGGKAPERPKMLGNPNNVLKSVEMYYCKKNAWISVKEMNIERYGHSACVVQGKIFVRSRRFEC